MLKVGDKVYYQRYGLVAVTEENIGYIDTPHSRTLTKAYFRGYNDSICNREDVSGTFKRSDFRDAYTAGWREAATKKKGEGKNA